MANQNQEVRRDVLTPEGRVLFPEGLFEAKPVMKNGKPQGDPIYSCRLVLSTEDAKAVKQHVVEVVKERWPGKDPREFKLPFKNGDKEADRIAERGKNAEYLRGNVLLDVKNKVKQPGILGPDKNPILNRGDIYSGAYVLAHVTFCSWESDFGKGVTCYVNHVMKTRDGDNLFGISADQAFKDVPAQSKDVDPTGGDGMDWGDDELDDEIPF